MVVTVDDEWVIETALKEEAEVGALEQVQATQVCLPNARTSHTLNNAQWLGLVAHNPG